MAVQVHLVYRNANSRTRPEIFCCGHKGPNHRPGGKKPQRLPQNMDLPPVLPKKKKKPFPIPLRKILEASREDKKLAQMGIEKPLEPPKNGLLLPELIPVAYETLDAWKNLIKGLTQLLYVVPVQACRYCLVLKAIDVDYIALACNFLVLRLSVIALKFTLPMSVMRFKTAVVHLVTVVEVSILG